MWLRGDLLSPETRARVLAWFVHRWTVENAGRIPEFARPRTPLVTDAEWLRAYCFKVTARGTLDRRNNHCEPAWWHDQEISA